MIKVKKADFNKLSDKEINEWEFVIKNSSDATVFHTYNWVKTIIEEESISCSVIIAYNSGKPVGVYPYFYKIRNFVLKNVITGVFETPYGGPIFLDTTKMDAQYSSIKTQIKESTVIKSTIILPPNYDIDAFRNLNFKITNKETLIIDLNKNEEILWNNLHSMKIRNIKKALKNNVEVKFTGLEDIGEFHAMLESTYKRLGLSSPKPLDFYIKLFNAFKDNNTVKLLTAYRENKPIASCIFLFFKDTIIYWQGASYEEFMKFAPNDLIHWSIIQEGAKMGYKKYNLLHFHDNKGKEIVSLKNYKMSFGAELCNYYIVEREKKLFTFLKKMFN